MLSAALLLLPAIVFPRIDAQAADTRHPPIVSITAVATDQRARPVTDLKRDDFTLRENGAPQPLEAVEFRRSTARLFAFFFDEYHVSAGAPTIRARAALAQFLDERVRPDDRLIAMKPLDPITSIRTSSDRAAIRRAVEAFAGCKGEYAPRTPFEAEYMSRAPESAAVERARVVLSDLTALTAQLGLVRDVPKAVVFVTEGFGSDLRGVALAANRAGVAVYVIDPGATPAEPAAALRALAEDTGGTITAAAMDLPAALADIARDLESHYVLTYRTAAPPDGKFHALEVSTRRRGVQVRARRGYWSPLPPLVRAVGPVTSFPLNDMLAAHASPLIQPWFRMSRGPQGRTRLTFSWQPSGRAPAAKSGPPALLQLNAATPDGTAIFRGAVAPLTGPERETGNPTQIVMDVPPGRLRTEMSISDAAARVLDRDIRFLDIPDLHARRIIIMPPEIVRTRTAREFRELTGNPDAPPTPAREFNRFERLLIRVRAYGPGEAPPEIRATLINAVGQRLREIVRVSQEHEGTVQFDLPLSVLARGDYSIEIAAATGGTRSSQLLPIRIKG